MKFKVLWLVCCLLIGAALSVSAAEPPLQLDELEFMDMELGVNTVYDMEAVLGGAWRGTENPSDKNFVFPNGITATTESWNKRAAIYRITVENAEYATSRGISVGSSADEVLYAYGEPSRYWSTATWEYYMYFYRDPGVSLKRITFGVEPESQVVKKIVYSATAGGL